MSHQSSLIAEDIDAYLKQHEDKELLRFLTCGSVDDGKSTLIGRLLHDSKMIFEDQLAAIEKDSTKHGTTGNKIDLALLVDGLQAEREQGITIDVAYRYFSTEKRKFIIADTPGHEQYTRNMVTGASTCDLAIILIDARYGVQTQTRRHSYIASLLGIKHIVCAINKMDLLDFDQAKFESIKADYAQLAEKLGMSDVNYVPISALDGDNVVDRSTRCDWYIGQTLMEILESAPIAEDRNLSDFRFPVQYVNRPNLNFRGFCGTVASGVIAKGDEVKVLPSGKTSTVKAIITAGGEIDEAFVDQSVALTLDDEIDISRGDMIVKAADPVSDVNAINAHLVWMSESTLETSKEYLFKFAGKTVSGHVNAIEHRIDVNTQQTQASDALALNDIALVNIELSQRVVVDPYEQNRATGSFIVIDRLTNVTIGAGMVVSAAERESRADNPAYSQFEIELNALVRKHFPHWGAKNIAKGQ
ncbi:sulfate adenylyltransferase subunit CysN [Simiduia agarivorans]|uniref:Sulfate adenylyltransferase subunit 1 n=1 Tax=Simiduia agarivorans (strain DSM 21679 / JCM 13881 / BCRC 17597 / SA1) TaxID=1117647 RepID=K4KUZ2_SIMAS|nr:sulfate adenylyltransferase subunit CysN [Simiduia agarivorans]AFU97737.1 sulfate adenylyltransferase subunit 1 [Simiduia agarivorans SA1 = DSM 21679]